MSKQTAHLENWKKSTFHNSLTGYVTGHPKLEDGDLITTSKILNLDEENNTVETLNTIYTLGKKEE